jgi:hypothetical protein
MAMTRMKMVVIGSVVQSVGHAVAMVGDSAFDYMELVLVKEKPGLWLKMEATHVKGILAGASITRSSETKLK